MQGLLDTAEREFRSSEWRNSANPTDDSSRTQQKGPGHTHRAAAATPHERGPPPSHREHSRAHSGGAKKTKQPRQQAQIDRSSSPFASERGEATAINTTTADFERNDRHPHVAGDARTAASSRSNSSRATLSEHRQLTSRKRPRAQSELGNAGSRTGPSPPSRGSIDDGTGRPSVRDLDQDAENATQERRPSRGTERLNGVIPCRYEGCTKAARSAARGFCRRHGEERRCKTPGCNKVDVGGGNCRKHGGGRRCGASGCVKTDVGGGFCVSHGGGKRCQADGCAKGAQAGGQFCKSHGGGRRCRIDGCMTSAQSGVDVLCIKHGGGKRCLVPGCKKLVRKNNRCTKHSSQASDVPRLPPPEPTPPSRKPTHPPQPPCREKATAVAQRASKLSTSSTPSTPHEDKEVSAMPPRPPSPRSPSPARRPASNPAAREPDVMHRAPPEYHGNDDGRPRFRRSDEREEDTRRYGDSNSHFRPRDRRDESSYFDERYRGGREYYGRDSGWDHGVGLREVEPSRYHTGMPMTRGGRVPFHGNPWSGRAGNMGGGADRDPFYERSALPNAAMFDGGGAGGASAAPAWCGPPISRDEMAMRIAANGGVSSSGGGSGGGTPDVAAFGGASPSARNGEGHNQIPSPDFASTALPPPYLSRPYSNAPSLKPPTRGPLPLPSSARSSRVEAVAAAAMEAGMVRRGMAPGKSPPLSNSGDSDEDLITGRRTETRHDVSSLSHEDMAAARVLGLRRVPLSDHSDSFSGDTARRRSPPPAPSSASPNFDLQPRQMPLNGGPVSRSPLTDFTDREGFLVGVSRGYESDEGGRLAMGRRRVEDKRDHFRNWSKPDGSGDVDFPRSLRGPDAPSGMANSPFEGGASTARLQHTIAPVSSSTMVDSYRPGDAGSGAESARAGAARGRSSPDLAGESLMIAPEIPSARLSRAADTATPVTNAIAAASRRSSCCQGQGRATAVADDRTAGVSNPTVMESPGGSPRSAARPTSRSPSPLFPAPTYISLSVKNMMCMQNCGQTVQRVLSKVPGVRSVTVHFPTRTASVQIETGANVTPKDLTSAVDMIGFEATCIATSTTEEPHLEEAGVNAVWAIASALGLVDRGCAMAWGDACNCGDDCKCVNCPQHMKKVSHAVDLVLQAVDLSSSADTPPKTDPGSTLTASQA